MTEDGPMSRHDNAAANMPRQHPAHRPGPPAFIVTWGRLGRAAGYFAGVAFLAQTVLYLLDVTGALALQTQYQVTERGSQQDLIDYYINNNDRMHSIWWNVALRDVLGPLGYLALMVLISGYAPTRSSEPGCAAMSEVSWHWWATIPMSWDAVRLCYHGGGPSPDFWLTLLTDPDRRPIHPG
jgi:hypothetical protein